MKSIKNLLKIYKIENKMICSQKAYIKVFKINGVERNSWTEDSIQNILNCWRQILVNLNLEVNFVLTSFNVLEKFYSAYIAQFKRNFDNDSPDVIKQLSMKYISSFRSYLKAENIFEKRLYIVISVAVENQIFKPQSQKDETNKRHLNILSKRTRILNGLFKNSAFSLEELNDFDLHLFISNYFSLRNNDI